MAWGQWSNPKSYSQAAPPKPAVPKSYSRAVPSKPAAPKPVAATAPKPSAPVQDRSQESIDKQYRQYQKTAAQGQGGKGFGTGYTGYGSKDWFIRNVGRPSGVSGFEARKYGYDNPAYAATSGQEFRYRPQYTPPTQPGKVLNQRGNPHHGQEVKPWWTSQPWHTQGWGNGLHQLFQVARPDQLRAEQASHGWGQGAELDSIFRAAQRRVQSWDAPQPAPVSLEELIEWARQLGIQL